MATLAAPPESGTDQVDITRIAAAMWRHRLALVVALALALLGAVLYLNRATYKHEASVVLVPAEQASAFSTEGLASLSAIIGVELTPQSGSGFALFREAAESLDVAAALAKDERIVSTVFSHLRDPATGAWREPSSALRTILDMVRQVSGAPPRRFRPPGAEEMQQYLRANVSVAPDRRRALTVVRYLHADPEFARYLVGRLIEEADSFLRAKSLARSSEYIAYLESRLSEVQIAEHRSALTQALSSYEMMRMMASSDVPFTAEPFGEIMVSMEPVSPRPVVVYAAAILLGLLAWGVYVFAVEMLFSGRARAAPAEPASAEPAPMA